ncbi:hypothetical protein ABZ471_39805 [Streptomyces sp. NPDC005728]|uniref:hypothetical protein n=1 Tax=Streptomyces sp. NPDC005728 TaxID=3157054 RepID=UPI0033EB1C13
MAVREADSRLATALRYARAVQLGGTGRFTTRSGHDTCFHALADVVAIAERHPQIAAITMIRRDGQALLRHETGGLGRASWALAAERLRPYMARFSASTRRCAVCSRSTGPNWTTSPLSPGP